MVVVVDLMLLVVEVVEVLYITQDSPLLMETML